MPFAVLTHHRDTGTWDADIIGDQPGQQLACAIGELDDYLQPGVLALARFDLDRLIVPVPEQLVA